jgi:hypothetical protein
MLERSQLPLKFLCWALMALVLYRLILVIVHINPLYHVKIPALPALPPTAESSPASAMTNSAGATKPGTNTARPQLLAAGTNTVSKATNALIVPANRLEQTADSAHRSTNLVAKGTNTIGKTTNSVAQATNSISRSTNSPAAVAGAGATPVPPHAVLAPSGMPGGPMPSMAKPGPELPPQLQARLDRVIESEILAPVMRPLPMALLGIAGESVFLRASNGQTGLIKEGEELGGVKLLRIGVNRVLVEEQGDQKELTIFAGLGGESLLTTQKSSPK